MGGLGQKPLPHIRTANIFHLFLGRWFCNHCPLFGKFAMLVFSPLFGTPLSFHIIFQLSPMLALHMLDATRHSTIPIYTFFLGLSSSFMTKVRLSTTIAWFNAKGLCISDVHIDGHCSLENWNLWACFHVGSSLQFLRDNLDRSPVRMPLGEVVYRDGQSDLFSLLSIF